MKKTKFLRITAFLLTLVFLFCSVATVVGAKNNSVSDKTTSDIKELLNAISYGEYSEINANEPRATKADEIIFGVDQFLGELSDDTSGAKPYLYTNAGGSGVYLPNVGAYSWGIELPQNYAKKKFNVVIDYYPVANKAASIERIFMINGEVPFAEARYMTISKIWKNIYPDGQFELESGEDAQSYLTKAASLNIVAEKVEENGKTIIKYKMPEYWTAENSAMFDEVAARFFAADIDGNEIRSSLIQAPTWTTFEFKDSSGFYSAPFEFVIGPDPTGNLTLTLESVNEPIVISQIRLVAPQTLDTYDSYLGKYAGAPDGKGVVKIEGEYFSATSSQTIYPISDNTSAITSPASPAMSLLNTMGGEKWQGVGQWIEYKFSVSESGMYEITPRFKQDLLDGMYTSRAIRLYSDGAVNEGEWGYYNGLPFEEANKLKFNYSSEWQSGVLTDGETDFKFYFAKGVVYRIRFEVSLGSNGDIVRRVQNVLDTINAAYLNIMKLTGSNPDENRDYGFSRVMPDTMKDMLMCANELEAIAKELSSEAGVKSSMTATLEDVARLLRTMGLSDDAVAKNLENLKTQIGTLGTWLSDAKTQPLTIDFFNIQAPGMELPQAKAGFWKSLVYEIVGFFQSFFRNYDRMGALSEDTGSETVEVWLAYGRDQSQVIRGLINNNFTPKTGVPINLKLVAAGTLLPSILSRRGPDVYIGLDQGSVINYAIRGALLPIEGMDGYAETVQNFNEAAMIVLGIEDAEGNFHTYGLPETQSFSMMFIREDILAELDIEVPKTWNDVKEAIPVLQSNNMMIGMSADVNMFLYQSGGELFADEGMRINLDSNVALEAFNTMCDMFTMYSFPYKYDAANRFRTGEMPILFSNYTATYNQLKVFATEIEGLWSFYPLPGYENEAGDINNMAVSSVTANVMITGCENVGGAWNFMQWFCGSECQVDYSNEMVAILGPSAKHPTANKEALEEMPWTAAEYGQLKLQFQKLAAVPNYPGAYIVARYTNFAFLDAFNNGADPATSLQSYITIINKEITRKRAEFGLETLDYVGQTLAQKRMAQAEKELEEIRKDSSYQSAYDVAYNNVMEEIKEYKTEDYATLRALANDLERLNDKLFATAVKYLRDAASSLESYEAYK